MEKKRLYCTNCGLVITWDEVPSACPRCTSRSLLPVGEKLEHPRHTMLPVPRDAYEPLGLKPPPVSRPDDLENPAVLTPRKGRRATPAQKKVRKFLQELHDAEKKENAPAQP